MSAQLSVDSRCKEVRSMAKKQLWVFAGVASLALGCASDPEADDDMLIQPGLLGDAGAAVDGAQPWIPGAVGDAGGFLPATGDAGALPPLQGDAAIDAAQG